MAPLSRIIHDGGKMERMSDNEGDSEKVHVWTVEVQGEPIQDHGEPAPHVTPADEAAAD